jgi:hypothetical protein
VCARIASRYSVIMRKAGERIAQFCPTRGLLLAPSGKLVSEVLVMPGAGSVYERCGCRGVGSAKAREDRCSALPRRGRGSGYFSVELKHALGSRHRVRRGGFASRGAAREGLRQVLELKVSRPSGRVSLVR